MFSLVVIDLCLGLVLFRGTLLHFFFNVVVRCRSGYGRFTLLAIYFFVLFGFLRRHAHPGATNLQTGQLW